MNNTTPGSGLEPKSSASSAAFIQNQSLRPTETSSRPEQPLFRPQEPSFRPLQPTFRPQTPEPERILPSATSWNASVTQPPYTPQFSPATALLLNSIKGGQPGTQSFSAALSDASATVPVPDKQAFDAAKSKLVQGMATSMVMPPMPPQSTQKTWTVDETVIKQEPSEVTGISGVKRKRDDEEEPVDFTQNTMVMPPLRAPRKNQLQRRAGGLAQFSQVTEANRKQQIEQVRQKRLAALPEGIAPAKPEHVGFGPGSASDYARSQYFYGMKRTELLNLLSFADQLRPQLLVDIMVSVSKRHPDLPIFGTPDWDANIPEPRGLKTARSKPLAPRARHGHSLLNSKAKQRMRNKPGSTTGPRSALKKPRGRSRLAQEMMVPNDDSQAEEAEEEDEEDVDAPPPTWPQPGEGLYAKLVPETEDRGFLADENDEEAFSGFWVDKMGRQIIDPV